MDNQYWVYSDKTLSLLRTYINRLEDFYDHKVIDNVKPVINAILILCYRFPKVISVISNHNSNKKLYQEQLEQKRIS